MTIVDDAMPENSEFFNAYVRSASPKEVIIGNPRQPLIEIRDSVDGECLAALICYYHCDLFMCKN